MDGCASRLDLEARLRNPTYQVIKRSGILGTRCPLSGNDVAHRIEFLVVAHFATSAVRRSYRPAVALKLSCAASLSVALAAAMHAFAWAA